MEKSRVKDATAREPGAGLSESGVSIYVVDDEPVVGDLVATMLKAGGFKVRLFHDPAEALKVFIAANPRPVLLLTDFVMGGLNGMELITRCKQAQPTLKTILYSANEVVEITQHYSVKPDIFIRKPFHAKNLVDIALSVLAQ